ncbi:hypothetical protein [Mesorhizobium sp.]|uniref:hypothetical protein n=1 Tax=Mesorhizobium sp. TaxID=1871066 RepID=UPI000FE4AEDE|nr:hypothetical protein [Mesorhizobium sp.]RWF64120.1 MAG: hypothetical protein EOS47_16240 [Mesorhizobium sp.]TIT44716.1 MAG: hypothetical protein E5W76_01160 [Mesorhizobium sp.]
MTSLYRVVGTVLLLCLLQFPIAVLTSAYSAQEAGWLYYGKYNSKASDWINRYFAAEGNEDAKPRPGRHVRALEAVTVRSRPIAYIEGEGWKNGKSIGAVQAGESVTVREVVVVNRGYYWIRIALSGGATSDSELEVSGDANIIANRFEIGTKHGAENFTQWFAGLRVSPQGQAITKAVAAYYGVPPEVVDLSTNLWKDRVKFKEIGNEVKGAVLSPEGYTICNVEREGEISITGKSSMYMRVSRDPEPDGLQTYLSVPFPRMTQPSEWADVTFLISFVKKGSESDFNCIATNMVVADCPQGPDSCKPNHPHQP